MELTDRVVLVTGAAVRVGRVIVEELAQAGAHAVVHYHRSGDAAEALADRLREGGARALTVQANVANAGEVSRMFEAIDEEFGRIDALVNNAGVFRRTPFPDLTEEDWDYHLDANLKGTFLCCREASRRMIAQGEGRIVNIADAFGDRPWPGYLPYCVSKAGIVTLTRTLARALARHNVQVNAVGPGAVLFPDGYTEDEVDKVLEQVPSGRPGTPEDVARTVRFLIEGPEYITGAVIPVDGGASTS